MSLLAPPTTLLAAALLGAAAAVWPASAAPSPRGSSDYSPFQIIEERNIFNPRRQARVPNQPVRRERASRVDTIALVGIMRYEKGPFAFFDGSRGDYRKVLQPDGAIGDFKMLEIGHGSVRLAEGTNRLELAVGKQLRREDDGPWRVADAPEHQVAASGSAPSSSSPYSRTPPVQVPQPMTAPPPAPGADAGAEDMPPIVVLDANSGVTILAPGMENGATNGAAVPPPAASEDEIVRRMMERRAQEMNR